MFYQTEPTRSASQAQKGFQMATLPAVKAYAAKTSSHRRTSTGLGMPKSQTARWGPVRCLPQGLNETWNTGKGAFILEKYNSLHSPEFVRSPPISLVT